MIENGISHAPDGAQNPISGGRDMSVDSDVIVASNRLIEAKKAAPGGEAHAVELVNLVDLLANNPAAINSLLALQNGNAK